MKFWKKFLQVLTALTFLCMGIAVAAEGIFGVRLLSMAAEALGSRTALWVLISLLILAACLFMAVHYVLALFGRDRTSQVYMASSTGAGTFTLSENAMRGLLSQCADLHKELRVLDFEMEEEKGGVAIDVHTATVSNIDIPRATAELKAQIEDFIPRCTGLTLRRVRILVDKVNVRGDGTGYGIPGPSAKSPLQRAARPARAETPAPAPAAPKDHQRSFTAEEAPAASRPESVEPLPADDLPEILPAEAPAAPETPAEPATEEAPADAQP